MYLLFSNTCITEISVLLKKGFCNIRRELLPVNYEIISNMHILTTILVNMFRNFATV